MALALQAADRPETCREVLIGDMSADTSRGALASRKNLWGTVARRAGYQEPFALSPELIYTVMGALKIAHYRSAELYLDAAKAEHVQRGHPWTDQLVLARRAAIRSCRRHIGHPRQAKLGNIQQREPLACGGPEYLAQSTLLASWWLLREIEASSALRKHISIDRDSLSVSWTLPCTKTDQQALGAVRTHRCACDFTSRSICPYHVMVAHLDARPASPEAPVFQDTYGNPPSKAGWADTFQELARRL